MARAGSGWRTTRRPWPDPVRRSTSTRPHTPRGGRHPPDEFPRADPAQEQPVRPQVQRHPPHVPQPGRRPHPQVHQHRPRRIHHPTARPPRVHDRSPVQPDEWARAGCSAGLPAPGSVRFPRYNPSRASRAATAGPTGPRGRRGTSASAPPPSPSVCPGSCVDHSTVQPCRRRYSSCTWVVASSSRNGHARSSARAPRSRAAASSRARTCSRITSRPSWSRYTNPHRHHRPRPTSTRSLTTSRPGAGSRPTTVTTNNRTPQHAPLSPACRPADLLCRRTLPVGFIGGQR